MVAFVWGVGIGFFTHMAFGSFDFILREFFASWGCVDGEVRVAFPELVFLIKITHGKKLFSRVTCVFVAAQRQRNEPLEPLIYSLAGVLVPPKR